MAEHRLNMMRLKALLGYTQGRLAVVMMASLRTVQNWLGGGPMAPSTAVRVRSALRAWEHGMCAVAVRMTIDPAQGAWEMRRHLAHCPHCRNPKPRPTVEVGAD